MRSLLPLALVTACVPAPERVHVLALTDAPARHEGRRIEVCGDLARTEQLRRGRTMSDPRPPFEQGFALYSPGGEGSPMHGRVGVFIPRATWLTPHDGQRRCVVGTLTHWTGLTAEQVLARPFREVTSSAVDALWRFNAVSARPAD